MAFENQWHAQREAALDLILEATLRPEAWNDVITHVCKVVGANSGAIAIRSSAGLLESLAEPLRIGLDTRRRLKGTMVAHGVLARLAIPVVTLDERGRVDHMNQAAEKLFGRGDIVSISGGRIRTNRLDTTKVLQAMCYEAVRGDISRQGHELFLERAGGAPPLRLSILPLSHRLSDSLWGGDVPAAIFFCDAQQDTPLPDVSTRLRQAHGYTNTEAKIAVLYADGATGPQIAKQLQVSSETIKTHLKKVFQKTGVKNKAELVKLIQKLGSPVR